MKACITCKLEKELTEFYRHDKMKDGYRNACKLCRDIYSAEHYRQNKERKLTLGNAYRKRTKELRAEKVLAAQRLWALNNKDKIRENELKYKENNKIKLSAKNKVNYEISMNRLTRMPCEICGKEKTHGHHDDYSKPLIVRWLCRKHHTEWHMENGEGLNGK